MMVNEPSILAQDVEQLIVCEAHQKGVNWIDFHPNKKQFATCSDDKLIKIYSYNITNADEVYIISGHLKSISCIKYSSCGEQLYSCSEDG